MSGVFGPLAVQSYCFRKISDNAKVAAAVKEIGLDRIEVCRVHCDFDKPESVDSTISTYKAAGVTIVSLGVERLQGDEALDRPKFDFARKAGARNMSIDFAPGNMEKVLPLAQKLSEEYGVKLGIHNHGGYHWLGSRQILDYIFGRAGKGIGLCMDTAWALDAGEDPVKMAEQFGARLYAMHLKDFTFKPDRKRNDVVVGTGNLNLEGLKAAGKAAGFAGPAILEYEGDPENPIPTLKACVEVLRKSGF